MDNFTARLTINQLCAKHGQPWFESGVSEDALSSHVQLIVPGQTACFGCAMPLAASEGTVTRREGVCVASLPTTMSITAGLMVHNALKFMLSFGQVGGCINYQSLNNYFSETVIKPNPDCKETFCLKAQANPPNFKLSFPKK